MFHMLSCFNLKAGEDITTFQSAYTDFVASMKRAGLVEHSGPIGRRRSETPMDTDHERNHEYFGILSFRDQGQADAAYAYIKGHVQPGTSSHDGVYSRVEDPVFICWQDLT